MNKKPKVLCITDLSLVPDAIELLNNETDFDYRPDNKDVVSEIIQEYDAFWGHVDFKVDKELLEKAVNLKTILTAATGTNHIDKKTAAEKGIKILCIARDYKLLDTFTATAECAWMLMMACHRNLRQATAEVSEGKWDYYHLMGRQFSGHTLGVLGVGRLGSMAVEYGKAFRMRVLGCDLKPFSIDGVESVDFDTILRESDALSIHIHMEDRNYHLFNDETFSKMKDGAILVNTSRGDVIDEDALLSALDSGKLAAFGADVLHDEWREDMLDSPVVKYSQTHQNVVITPHLGGCTVKSIHDARMFAAEKLVHYLNFGEELIM
ncbi:MAG: NAD(P)-dependent oxidoreductase [Planctomycetota bacterium]|jgi:D-3-phosphoglycerate dehydrogenase